jgi:hypothetical protein
MNQKQKERAQLNSLKSWDLLHQTRLDSILQRLHSSFVCPLMWSLDYILHCFPILTNLIFNTLHLIQTISPSQVTRSEGEITVFPPNAESKQWT